MVNANIQVNPKHIDSRDRSFAYGDGCFTTMFACEQRVFLLDQHIQRLQADARKLFIHFDNWHDVSEQIKQIALGLHFPHVVKVVVSRGIGGRGYSPETCEQAEVYIFTFASSAQNLQIDKPAQRLAFANVRMSSQPALSGIKHNNRLEQVIAKQECVQRKLNGEHIDDLLLLNNDGYLIEATSANVFYELEGEWYTPDLTSQGVDGVMRKHILSVMYDAGIPCHVALHKPDELRQIRSAFICNAVQIIQVVSHIELQSQVIELCKKSTQKVFALTLDSLCRVDLD
ncbi:aminodeoxychorismate lyase [Agaribacter flavus]|uniref:Aminodeoxychorismate lyase n=1 Tax=Agaribacter flavus TaxID=1902781 RepID=A0ABV7FPG1_9ALTE